MGVIGAEADLSSGRTTCERSRRCSAQTYYALAAEVAACSLPALQAGRLVALEVRIEPAE
jgi:hypothetical protein